MVTDQPQQAAPSPLTEPSPVSLEELFSRDPFSYTKQDRTAIVTALRAMRTKWDELEAQGKKPKAQKVGAATKEPAKAVDLSALGLLGGDGQ